MNEHKRVVLTTYLPSEKLATGDVGTIVRVYRDGQALEVEFVALNGETLTVVTVEQSQVRPIEHREITHAWRLA